MGQNDFCTGKLLCDIVCANQVPKPVCLEVVWEPPALCVRIFGNESGWWVGVSKESGQLGSLHLLQCCSVQMVLSSH